MKQFKFASTLLSIIFGAVIGFAHSVEVTQAFEPFDEFTPAEEPEEFIAEPWSVNYVPSWGSTSAPEDGSIGIWADGWFIVHSGPVNGNVIFSMPESVEVDKQIYFFTELWIAGDSIDTHEIARVRANHGIVFQTCVSEDLNLLVHYEPAGGDGYPYEFIEFPYTVNDGIVFGQ